MDRGPGGDDQFVVDADFFDLISGRTAGRVERECFDGKFNFGGSILNGAKQPLVTFPCSAGHDLFCALQFLFSLLLLEQVDVKAAILHVFDNGIPRQGHACGVAESGEDRHVGSEEIEPIATVSRFCTIATNVIEGRSFSRLLLVA